MEGYLQSLGVFKENAVLTFKNKGQFDIQFEQPFFGEAPAKIKIQDKNGFNGYLKIQPIVCFYVVNMN